MLNIISELSALDLVKDVSDSAGIDELQAGENFYVGFDPTAPSLQIGNLFPLMLGARLAQSGLKPIILFGGSTGRIGDPSGKQTERPLLPVEQLESNIDYQQRQVEEIYGRLGLSAQFVNNLDWTKGVSIVDFLRDVGKHFTVNYMISKEVVSTRLGGEGISYTEFSYMLLQAFDFLHLYQSANCRLQIGGSDQWGNITAGLELIRRKVGGQAYGLSFPLIVDSQGRKFGKSENGTVWLGREHTSPYQLYQFLLNTSDSEALQLIKSITLITKGELNQLTEQAQNPEKRVIQQELARRVVKLVHGEESLAEAQKGTQTLFKGDLKSNLTGLAASQIDDIFSQTPSCEITRAELDQTSLGDLIIRTKLCSSKGETRRLIQQGGAYLNDERVKQFERQLKNEDLINNNLLVLRSGKKKYALVRITD